MVWQVEEWSGSARRFHNPHPANDCLPGPPANLGTRARRGGSSDRYIARKLPHLPNYLSVSCPCTTPKVKDSAKTDFALPSTTDNCSMSTHFYFPTIPSTHSTPGMASHRPACLNSTSQSTRALRACCPHRIDAGVP